ncbi:MAG TPA: class I SAM-dependent methyltransferase [Bacteroidales bacterium]|nr:class I SAM-dependent methyltransferase [Bacteroidales bacterium]HOU95412.1 class I SAM-dependent methyltransferase [Bacteroidales bacterium]HQG36309.1 class I SAM-dependent methyltransferase [Bacteroidales bacterium]HQG52507.1 class I SAM-dependent methyltransferase [Bacteroidales bacterium]HQJ20058.1 class I SAM-dependent methyltransferase [Bacteroidales bacterium]
MFDEKIVCPACGSFESISTEVSITQTGIGGIIYRRCLSCKSYFNPNMYQKIQKIKHIQQHTAYGNLRTGLELVEYKSLMYRSILELIKRYFPPPANILDVGCSFGGFLVQARDSGYVGFGMDIFPEAVEYTRSLNFNVALSDKICDVPFFKENELDIITILDTNYYFPDQPRELLEAWKKLKSGGFLVMRVSDKNWLFSFGLFLSKIYPKIASKIVRRAINDHLFSMPVKSLLRLLVSLEFKILYASPSSAMHSKNSSFAVKMAFRLGYLVWKFTGSFIAPGCVIIAQK